MYLTDRLPAIALAAVILALAGCAAAPKPVITTTQDTTAEELKTLNLAAEEYAQALKNMQSKKYNEAEKQMLSLAEKHPTFPGQHANLGIIYLQTNLYDKSEQSFDHALELNPNLAIVHNQKGYLYRISGKFDKALEAYSKALEVNPDYAQAHYNIR